MTHPPRPRRRSARVPGTVLARVLAWGIAAILWVLGGAACSSTSEPATGDLGSDLKHRDPRVRIDAAKRAVAEKRQDLMGVMVDGLQDEDPAVRMFLATALRKLTGLDFDYKPHGSLAEREEAMARWRAWLLQSAAKAPAGREDG